MNNEAPLRIGIIGYGGMGKYHTDRLRKLGIMEIVGAYDCDPVRLQAAKADGMIAYSSADALLGDNSIKAVLIATPNDIHCEYAIAAAKAGKHIICEKPAALGVSEIDEMEKAAKQNGVILTVHQNRRWDGDFIAAKQIIDSGVIGKVYQIDSFVCGANGIPGGWRKTVKAGGGMMLDWGVHLLDQIFCYKTESPEYLYCEYSHALGFDVDDGFNVKLGYKDGLTVNVRVDTNTFATLPRWIIYGRDGTAVIKDWALNGEITLPVYGSEVEIVGIEAGNGFTKTMAYRPHESVRTREIPKPVVDYDTFYKNFIASIQGKEKPCVTVESVRKILRVMELCNQSAKTNTVITKELKSL